MPPKLPRLPIPRLPHSPIEDLRKIVKDGRTQIERAADDIRSVAGELRGGITSPTETKRETPAPATPPSQEALNRIQKGTACTLCSSEHFTQVAGDLAEAMRFARDEGLTHPEVIKRIEHARQELNEMERYDLSPAEIERLSEPERDLADWALPRSRKLRHMINQTITSRTVSDLEKVAAQAEETALEFSKRLWALPSTAEECPECASLEDLRTYLEKIRRKRATP